MAESANAHTVLSGSAKLFSTDILESGNLTVLSGFAADVQDGPYQQVLNMFDIKGRTAREPVEASKKIPLYDILANFRLTFPARSTRNGYCHGLGAFICRHGEQESPIFPRIDETVMSGCTNDNVANMS